MITTLQVYFLCVTITFTFLYTNYLRNLEYGINIDDDIQQIFDNKVLTFILTFILIFIISILWFLILPIAILDNFKTEGGNNK